MNIFYNQEYPEQKLHLNEKKLILHFKNYNFHEQKYFYEICNYLLKIMLLIAILNFVIFQ